MFAIGYTRQFMDRYGLPAVIGLAILWGFLASAKSHRLYPTAAFLIFSSAFLIKLFPWPSSPKPAQDEIDLERTEPHLPIAIGTGIWFLQLDHYASPALSKRLVYLRDSDAALHYTGANVFEIGYPILKKWYPVRSRVEDYRAFLDKHEPFLVYISLGHPLDWLTRKLIDDRINLRLMRRNNTGTLYKALPDGPP
jgi:hypothetical protein